MNRVFILRLLSLVACAGLATGCSSGGESPVSEIKADETVVFFRTAAWLDPSAKQWQVPIHGWIFEAGDSTARKALFEEILQEKYGLETSAATESKFTHRVNLMIADNERGKEIVIALAGRDYVLPLSSPDGHFETTLQIPATELESHTRDGLLTYKAVTADAEQRQFFGRR